MRRAARHQGFFPGSLEHPDQLAEIAAELTALQRESGKDAMQSFDIVVDLSPGRDPAPFAAVGATWWLVGFPWDAVTVDEVRGVIRRTRA